MNRGGRREGEESRVQSWAGIRSWFANKIRVLNGQTKWTGRPVADLLTGFSSPRQPEDLLVFVQLSLHAPLPPHIALLIRSRIEINLDILTGAGFLSFIPFNRSSFLIGRLYVSYRWVLSKVSKNKNALVSLYEKLINSWQINLLLFEWSLIGATFSISIVKSFFEREIMEWNKM